MLEILQDLEDSPRTNFVGPGERSPGIVDAAAHGGIGTFWIANPLQHRVCRLVGQQGDSAHHEQPRNIVDHRDRLPERLKESDLSRHLENGNATPADEAGDRELEDDEGASLAETDYELNEALNLLKGLDILRVKG